jgi:hypothetical protein
MLILKVWETKDGRRHISIPTKNTELKAGDYVRVKLVEE